MPDSNVYYDEIKISELPAADQANATDQLEANQDGTARRITLDQVHGLHGTTGTGKTVLQTSPELLGEPTAPTPLPGDNDQSIATTEWVNVAIAGIVGGSIPSGPAGGDLSGTYPNPTIKADVALSGSPTTTTPPFDSDGALIANTAWVRDYTAATYSALVTVSDTPPVAPAINALWWNSALGALYIYYDDGNTVQWVPASPMAVGGTITPEVFGAAGDGVATDDAAITAWLAYCTANNLKAVGTPGKSYKLSTYYTASIRTDFDGNGCQFVIASYALGGTPITQPVFRIESLASDIEDVALATVNTWAGLYRGSHKITQLAGQRGWSYAFYTPDALVITRAGVDPDPIEKGEAFEVTDDTGSLSKALVGSYTLPFAAVTAKRKRIRRHMLVKDLHIRITSSNYNREKTIMVERPQTTLEGCLISNDGAFPLDRGFTHYWTTSIVYQSCRVEICDPTETGQGQYGFDGYLSDDITFRNCSEGGCRRGIDSINCSNYVIDGGSYPDGIGGHWIEGMYVHGNPYLSSHHPNNLNVIHASGSNINIESARIQVTKDTGHVLRMRSDYPELRGICRLGPGVDITIDDTGPTTATIKEIMGFPMDHYDTLRAVSLPTIIDCTPGIIRQIGAASTNVIGFVSMPGLTAAQFPRNINMPVEINIEPRALLLEGGYSSGALTRLRFYLYKSDTAVGDPCRVRVDSIRRIECITGLASAAADTSVGRYDLYMRNITETPSNINLQAGVVRRALLENVDPAVVLTTTGGGGTALGDEVIEWNMLDVVGSYTPEVAVHASGLGASNLDSTPTAGPAYYTYDSKYTYVAGTGPVRKSRVTVHGSVTVDPTTAANTATTLFLSLPIAVVGTPALAWLTGIATRAQGDMPPLAGISMDTANKRAQILFPSNTAAAITLLYNYSYYF